jgi:histidine ammonia-lyase
MSDSDAAIVVSPGQVSLDDLTQVLAGAAVVSRKQVPALGADRYMADDLAKATALVAAGTLPAAAISVLNNNPFPKLAEKGHLS